VLNKRPIRRNKDGGYTIKLTDHERDVLRDLPNEVIKLMEDEEDSRSTFRLFPRAYENDLGRQVEYDRLMRDDLATRHIEALRMMQESADAKELSEEQIDAWIRALNQLRLVLGTRLDVTDDTDEDDFADDEATASAYALYSYLGYLQDAAVEAMSEAYPD
jgi:hypothetical protein